jgi:Family of unknown function (DUF6229)
LLQQSSHIERRKIMSNTSNGAKLVAQWRNGGGHNNPAGPLFAAGEFAQADIINAGFGPTTSYSICTGSDTISCC